MTKFRSLIFREFRINSKTYKAACLMIISFYLFLLVGTIIFSSMTKGQSEFDISLKSFESIYLIFLVVPYFTCMNDKSFMSDINTGWLNYSYTLPISASERTVAMFARSLITQIISMLVGLVGVFSLKLLTGEAFQIGCVVLSFITFALTLLMKSVVAFFTLKARNSDEYKKLSVKGNNMNMTVMICIVLSAFKFSGLDFEEIMEKSDRPLSFDFISMLTGDMLFWVIPLTIILSVLYFAVVYYRLQFVYSGGIKIKTRKEKEEAVDLTVSHSQNVGFLYKEIKQNSKEILAVIILPFAALIFLALCSVIVSVNEIFSGDGWPIEMMTSDLMRLVSIGLSYFLVNSLLLSVFHGDDRKLWAYFTVSLPNGVTKFLYTKYALSFAMCGLYLVSSYVAETLVATLRWFTFNEEVASYSRVLIILFFFILFQNSFSIPMMIRFGEKKGAAINLTLMIGLATAAVLILAFIPEEIKNKVYPWIISLVTNDKSDLTTLILRIFPFISIGAYLLSYKVSCKIFMKGVSEYDK